MRIHHLTTDEAFASLQSGPDGLSTSEAQRRCKEFGPNEVAQLEHEPVAIPLLKEFGHFFAVILWIAAALAFFADRREPGQGMAALGFAIVGEVARNVSFWQAYQAEQALRA